MENKRITKDRVIWHHNVGDDYFVLIDHSYHNKAWSYTNHIYEIGEFYRIKPTLAGLEKGLLTIIPTLLGLFEPITSIIDYRGEILNITNGLLHKEDGAACIVDNEQHWYLHGIRYTFDEFWEQQKETIHAAQIMANVLSYKSAKT